MATAFTHAFVGAALATVTSKPIPRSLVVIVAAALSVLPDIDALAFRFGIPYADVFGHRGFTHSLLFAALLACTASLLFIKYTPLFTKHWFALVALLFIATSSHGVLDALTDKGLGVGFFIPFDNGRYFFPVRPLATSPVSINRFFSGNATAILRTEIYWVWLPVLVAILPLWFWRAIMNRRRKFRDNNLSNG